MRDRDALTNPDMSTTLAPAFEKETEIMTAATIGARGENDPTHDQNHGHGHVPHEDGKETTRTSAIHEIEVTIDIDIEMAYGFDRCCGV